MIKRIYVITIMIICLIGTLLTAQATVRMGRKWLINAPFGGSEILKKYGDYGRQNGFVAKYDNISSNIAGMLRDVTTTYVYFGEEIKSITDTYKREIIRSESEKIVSYEGEAVDNVTSAAEAVVDLSNWASERGKGLVYVQIPNKTRCDLDHIEEISNATQVAAIERADHIVNIIRENGVFVCDLTGYDDLTRKMTFDESGHWSCKDALDATYIICEYFEKEGFITQEDLERFCRIRFNDVLEEEGVELNYYLPVPSPESDFGEFEAVVNEKDVYTGSFTDSILKDRDLWKDDRGAYHDLWKQKNGDTFNIHDTGAICCERLLVLGDSFSWPVTAYMSLMYENVDYINPQSYPGLTRRYIEINNPDVVLIAFSDVQAYDDGYGNLLAMYEGLR